MSEITLRLAVPEDAPALLAIYAPYVENSTASWELEAPSLAEFSARMRQRQSEGYPWLVAQRSGVPVGYAYAGATGTRKGYAYGAEVTVYLAPPAHGQGVGTQLYTALLQLLRLQGYYNALALITYPNKASAAFHASLGFVEEGRIENAGYKFEQWLGLSYYRLPLKAPSPPPHLPVSLRSLDAQTVQAILKGQET